MADQFYFIERTKNNMGGVVSIINANTDEGRKYFNESTDARLENSAKIAVDENGEPRLYDEDVVKQIANDAATMSGRRRTKNKISPNRKKHIPYNTHNISIYLFVPELLFRCRDVHIQIRDMPEDQGGQRIRHKRHINKIAGPVSYFDSGNGNLPPLFVFNIPAVTVDVYNASFGNEFRLTVPLCR